MPKPEYIVLARQMMGYDDLPQGLINMLGEVNEFVRLAGGELRSRQVVALIVAQWNARDCGWPDPDWSHRSRGRR